MLTAAAIGRVDGRQSMVEEYSSFFCATRGAQKPEPGGDLHNQQDKLAIY